MKKNFLFLLAFSAFVMTTTLTPLATATEAERVNILEEHNIEQKFFGKGIGAIEERQGGTQGEPRWSNRKI